MPGTPLGQVQANGLVTQGQLQEAVNALTEVITNNVIQLQKKTKNEIDKVNLQIQATTQQNLEIAANVTRESETFAGKMGEALGQLAQVHERVDEQLQAMGQRTEEFKNGVVTVLTMSTWQLIFLPNSFQKTILLIALSFWWVCTKLTLSTLIGRLRNPSYLKT